MTTSVQQCEDTAATAALCRQRSGYRTAILAGVLVVAGVANNALSLRWGFAYDDFVHQIVLRRLLPAQRLCPWSLYDFGGAPDLDSPMGRQGFMPWWTSPDFKVRFFRPVTSLSIWLDYTLYRDWAPGYHITSLVLFAIFLVLSYGLYRGLAGPGGAALWALAFLAFEDNVGMPVGWIANRNALLAALFVVATVLAVHHYRRRRNRVYLLLGIICFLLACGSKESGLAALPILALYLYCCPGQSDESASRGALLRLTQCGTLWIFVLLSAGYVVFYLASGYGTRAGIYATPWLDPADYLARLAALVPLGLWSLLYGFPTDLLLGKPNLLWPAVIMSLPVLAFTGFVMFRVLGRSPLAIFAIGWALVALLPEAGADLYDRLFMGASVGTALLIGLFLQRLAPLRQCIAARQYPRLAVGGLLVLTGIVVSVPSAVVRSGAWNTIASLDRTIATDAEIDPPPAPRPAVFLLNSPSAMLAWSMLPTWIVIQNDPAARIFPLQFGRRPLAWTRNGERTVTLTSKTTPFLSDHFEQLFLSRFSPPARGARYEAAEFTAIAEDVEPTGIRTLRLEFKKNLDDSSYRFLAWRDGRMARIDPPAIGQTVHIAAVTPLVPFAP